MSLSGKPPTRSARAKAARRSFSVGGLFIYIDRIRVVFKQGVVEGVFPKGAERKGGHCPPSIF